jgi:hypothetical protein
MASSNGGGSQGGSGRVEQIVIGSITAVVGWALGAGSGVVTSVQKMEVTLADVCKQMEEKKGVDTRQDKELAEGRRHDELQDRDLQRIMDRLNLPRR